MRAKLAGAEAALEEAYGPHWSAMAALEAQIDEVRNKQNALVKTHRVGRNKLERQAEAAHKSYERALTEWRGSAA